MTDEIRPAAETLHASELAALADQAPRPPRWKLSPRAVVTFIVGGMAPDGTAISPKYIGNRRLVESAVATLATDRALLLLGAPGTAKSYLSELLAAAISGDSTRVVQGTAGVSEEAVRYGWNYAMLLAHGPSRDALVPSPVYRSMAEGTIVRVEELTRMAPEVQDALLTPLSDKVLPIPELDSAVSAQLGFNMIATANDRDRGVNELSSALQRRFNTIVLPLPEDFDEELAIVTSRANSIARTFQLPSVDGNEIEVARLVQLFRELRSGAADGTKLKTPTGTLSAAEAISIVVTGIAQATHFGDGILSPRELVEGAARAVIRDRDKDETAWREYVDIALRKRQDSWPGWWHAAQELT